MKIVVDFRMHKSSGIGTYIRNLIPFLVDKFDFVLLGNEKEIFEYDWSKKVKIVNFNPKIYSISEQIKFPFKIPRCDVFWSPHYNVPVLPISSLRRISTIHDVFHLAFIKKLSFSQKIYAKFMIDQAIRRSDIVLTDSEFSKKEIIKYTGCLDNKIFIVYNAVNLNVFRKIEDIKLLKKVKNIYKLPEKFILFVGNVKPHKNLKGLLLAYKKLNSFDFKLVIVGKKEGFITGDNELSKLINTSDLLKKNVIFTGYVKDDDLPFIYNLASIFVFPSLYEGFGIPPLEAMACGCPCVVSNAASLPEVCGDSAYYVNPYDVEDIARGIETVLNDEKLRNDLIKKGFENIKRFSWEESAKKIIQIMREIKNRG